MPNKNQTIKEVACPTCKKTVKWTSQNNWRPFCSERCRLIDLGEWAAENHKIPDSTPPDFLTNNELEDSN